MNEISIGKYSIIFYEVPDYNENSTDNLPYDDVIDFDDGFNKTIAAEISDGIDTRKIALIVPYYTPHEGFALPMGDKVFLMLNDILCVFDPETGKAEKETHIDPMGTMFGAYAYGDDFILYGEIEIYRIDRDFKIKWRFFARDIFVRCDGGDPAFQMKADRICLYDFLDNYYEIDYDGKIILDRPVK